MGQALYRKHRSKSLQEIIGQEHITQTLAQALKQGRISHAYLFTGPRGVGKTSIARILAHEINGLPYTDDSTHLDIIEIDAASNRRIDEIRELRDKVYVAPTSAKYKVYIIDEVHMLTREAFNALLKTLEEPPAHVVFILATTDAHKLPETIISRTQRFTFKPVETAKVAAHLKAIAKEEGITVSDGALQLLAEHGEGSFRDSISLLDQASSQGQALDVADVQNLLGIPPLEAIDDIVEAIGVHAGHPTIVNKLTALYDQGYQAASIAQHLGRQLRERLIAGTGGIPEAIIFDLLQQLLEVPAAHDPEPLLEIILLRTQSVTPADTSAVVTVAVDAAQLPEIEQPAEPPTAKKTKAATPRTAVEPTASKQTAAPPKTKGTAPVDEKLWPQILHALKQRHNTLYGVVRMAQPKFTDTGLELVFAFAFHQKRISEAANRQVLVDIINDLTGSIVTIDCSVDKTAKPPKLAVQPVTAAPAADISAISNIFGGGELLES